MDQQERTPKILIAPLDWGLGHATRCVPIIKKLLQQNCEVIIAASGRGKALLAKEFPQLSIVHLSGYEIEYASTAWGLALKIVAQIPKLLAAIEEENSWLQNIVADKKIDAVISDNRYGLYHPSIPSVFITHQLRIKAPLTFVEDILQDINYRFINKFNECWIPDSEDQHSLAGSLSHPAEKPSVPVSYLGPLSRFKKQDKTVDGAYLLVLLSGPEPQRSLLEDQLLADLQTYTKPVMLVRGLPGEMDAPTVAENVVVYNHLPATELEDVIAGAYMVISRCGYSTVMDLALLQKKSILIPTPGQTEQEYLAEHLMLHNLAFCVTQKKFNLQKVLHLASQFMYKPFSAGETDSLDRVMEPFVQRLFLLQKNKAEE